MKNTFLALTTLTFVATQFATAQDPTVAVPTEQSEAAAAEASATPTPTRSKAASSGSEKSASPAPKSSSSPEPKTKTAASSPAASPAKKLGTEGTLRELENKWVASVASHKPEVAQQVLAEDYAGVSSRGQVMNKKGLLAQIQKDTDVYASVKITKMDVRVFGSAAVIIGTSTESGKDARGTAFARTYRWTDTWAQRNGTWQCVASQSTQVAK